MKEVQAPIGSGFGADTTPDQVMAGVDLGGKVAIVTGGHTGIGLETTKALVAAGATVVVGARDAGKAQEALSGMENVEALPLDLADPKSVEDFAAEYLRAHASCAILINNAGIMATPLTRDRRGYELQFATNHLGHFQLTTRLWAALTAAGSARVWWRYHHLAIVIRASISTIRITITGLMIHGWPMVSPRRPTPCSRSISTGWAWGRAFAASLFTLAGFQRPILAAS